MRKIYYSCKERSQKSWMGGFHVNSKKFFEENLKHFSNDLCFLLQESQSFFFEHLHFLSDIFFTQTSNKFDQP